MTRRERLAYAAGLMDGEGTITISRTRSGKNGWSYAPKVLLVNTDLRLVQGFRDLVGVGIVYQSRADRVGATPPNWNPIHRYQAVSLNARAVVDMLRPFLIAKAPHADIISSMPVRTRNHYDRSALPAQEAAHAAITALNRRGRKVI